MTKDNDDGKQNDKKYIEKKITSKNKEELPNALDILYKLYYTDLGKYTPAISIDNPVFSQSEAEEITRGTESAPATLPVRDRKHIIAPLREVFLEDKVMDTIIERTSIPELLEGKTPGYSGVILFGPPGTGKTAVMEALGEVYERAGAYKESVSLSQINTKYVGDFARNLDEIMKRALAYSQHKNKPSLVLIDEGSVLVQKAEEGSTSVAKHYQEAIDVLKRYVGNYREIVVVFATNEMPQSFEEALTREGRLTSQYIGYPGVEQRTQMWMHFANKYNLITLSTENAQQLAEATPQEQGAFIEEFCRNYESNLRSMVIKSRGHRNILSALEEGENIDSEEVRESINYENFYSHLKQYLQDKYERLRQHGESKKKPIGFNL